ncbi:ribonuclease M5 [Paenibacillus thermotolerans]|uniref:ribonuclease M5 n=1 Tax=Paenibacillus thermotolerans TaxID=3027807 RepID=UPI00236806F2|nr:MULTISPECIES: ribonuclease M5 [unclassified Paenibacillus]
MIREVIVVEGKSDTAAVRRAVEADTIETGGSAVNREVLARIELAQKRRGVIIFTDPDHAGERIRHLVSSRVPGCKHAFLSQEEATYRDDIGIENASAESIKAALEGVRTESEAPGTDIAWADLLTLGLAGVEGASERRLKAGKALRIGYSNGKTFLKRCGMFGINRQELADAMRKSGLLAEETHTAKGGNNE